MKQIYLLERRDGKASTSALAEAMGVSAASATAMVKKLAILGLVEHSRYHGVTLTPPGEKVALEVVRHHRLLEVYLTQTLGLSWDRVHSEAERLEHVLSEELEAEIDRVLGYPATDPHGDPIPTPDLVIAAEPAQRMAELEPGQAAVVRQVPDGDPSLLRYLAGLGPRARHAVHDGREGAVRRPALPSTSAARGTPWASSSPSVSAWR